MGKKAKIITISITLGVIALLSTGAGLWIGFHNPTLNDNSEPDPFFKTWMSSLKDDVAITDVIMPGAHDAATKGMITQAECQAHDISEQLNHGVRYFDLRVTKKGDDLVMFHGPIKGQKFAKVCDEFVTFMDANPHEFLILDFQHLGDNVNKEVLKYINENLPLSKMAKPSINPDISTLTMKDIRENNFSFMITWNNAMDAKIHDLYFRNDTLLSEYDAKYHQESNQSLIEAFDLYYSHHEEDKLFVLQAQRTAKSLLGRPSMYESKFKDEVNRYIDNIRNDKTILNKTNIIMRDFICSDIDNIKVILSLNIEKENIDEYDVSKFLTYTLTRF